MNNIFKKIIKHFLPLAIALCVTIVIDVNAQEVGMTTAEVTGEIISEKMQNPLDSSEENIIKGKRLYNNNCTVCHGRNGKIEDVYEAIMKTLDPKPSDLMNPLIYNDRTDWELLSVIRNGIKGTAMVSFKKILSLENTWLIVLYIKTLPTKILQGNQEIDKWSFWKLISSSLGYLLGLIGIILSIIFYRKSTIGPRPTYQLKVVRLLGENIDQLPGDVNIFFKKSKITQLLKHLLSTGILATLQYMVRILLLMIN